MPQLGHPPAAASPQQLAEVNADLLLLRRGGGLGRLGLWQAALLEHAQLEVLTQLREGNGGLQQRLEEPRAVLLLRRRALDFVFLLALLAADAAVAVEAAKRQPLAGHLLETGLRWRH